MKAIAVMTSMLAFSTLSGAVDLSCYEQDVTLARQCYEKNNVREKDGVRFSPLHTGGPKGTRDTGYTIHVNCKTNVVLIRDRQGVAFAGGTGNETSAVRHLRKWICAAKLRK